MSKLSNLLASMFAAVGISVMTLILLLGTNLETLPGEGVPFLTAITSIFVVVCCVIGLVLKSHPPRVWLTVGRWITRQSYFVAALIVATVYTLGILLLSLSIGVSARDSIMFSGALGMLTGLGFAIMKHTIPDPTLGPDVNASNPDGSGK